MNADIMTEALRATARVACCAALIGCHPSIQEDANSQYAAYDTDHYDEIEPTGDPTLGECREHVTEVFADGAEPTDTTEACCQAIAEHYDEQDLVGIEEWEERWACCELLGWGGTMACSPWGPPVPPAMPSMA